jgi:A nuclease family of the HNH/ENDO VII superfamily with conserved AHH
MDKSSLSTEEIFKQPYPNLLELTLAANQICTVASGENPYEIRNAIIIEKKKREILYKNGYSLPVKAEILANEAARNIRHGRKLATNMHRADPNLQRPNDCDAHHIVAIQDFRAKRSQKIMFENGVGGNDAANGCYTRRKRSSVVPSMPNSLPHENMHTAVYYLNVFLELSPSDNQGADICRGFLRAIGAKITLGTFPY